MSTESEEDPKATVLREVLILLEAMAQHDVFDCEIQMFSNEIESLIGRIVGVLHPIKVDDSTEPEKPQ
jgi:hypothetical protein